MTTYSEQKRKGRNVMTHIEHRAPVGEVWCRHCDHPAMAEVRLTSGEWAAYCARCIARVTMDSPGLARTRDGRQLPPWEQPEARAAAQRGRTALPEDDPNASQHEGTYES